MRTVAHTWERHTGTARLRERPLLSIVDYASLNPPVPSVRRQAFFSNRLNYATISVPSNPASTAATAPTVSTIPTARTARTMSSEDAYSAFLDKANQDTGASASAASKKPSPTQLKTTDTEVPAALLSVEHYYVSEADEPFEPVSLKWQGGNMPSENEFKDLIGHKAEVSSLTAKEFDPKGQYKDVFDAVERAGDGKARVFRVEEGGARVQYWVVGLDKGKGRVLGLRARGVES